jgi:hypothetical protein
MNDDMKNEYDFSRGERGKCDRQGAVVRLPVYLDDQVQGYLCRRGRTQRYFTH